MKNLILLIALLGTINLFGQGYGIETNFYSSEVPEMKTWDEMKQYWEGEVKSQNAKIEANKNDPELLYKLAIARHNTNEQNLLELIDLLNKAITLKSNEPKYYAVRGIIKYNWGAWSQDYDIGESCSDIKKSISMGLSKELKSNESIVGILKHPSCK